MNRRELKRQGRKSFAKHYVIYVVLCLLLAFLGVESASSIDELFSKKTNTESGYSFSINYAGSVKTFDVIDKLLGDTIDNAKAAADREKQNIAAYAAEHYSDSFQLKRGVLAAAINTVSSGSIYVTIASAVANIIGASAAQTVLIIFSLLFTVLWWMFFKSTLAVVGARVFLEGRIYSKITFQRFLFLIRVKRWFKASISIFVKNLFLFLWSFTIVGGFIKRYSYYLVPYIIAENPDVKPLEAIDLSRKMMYGYKFKTFVFELSFIGWQMLGIITLGVLDVFYTTPYMLSSRAELFAAIRSQTKRMRIPGQELLCDKYLYEHAGDDIIEKAYAPVIKAVKEAYGPEIKLTGVQGFVERNLGIEVMSGRKADRFEAQQIARARLKGISGIVEKQTYPGLLCPLPEALKESRIDAIAYNRSYSPTRLIILFFIFMFIGWIWEGSQGMVAAGFWINRGMLHGPWIPIYGVGGMIMLTVLYRLRMRPMVFFFTTMGVCGVIEYFTGYILELTKGIKWWDYSGYFLNLHGRICAEGLLAFGLLGMVVVYILAPLIDNKLQLIPRKAAIVICAVLLTVFVLDAVYSMSNPNVGVGITTITMT